MPMVTISGWTRSRTVRAPFKAPIKRADHQHRRDHRHDPRRIAVDQPGGEHRRDGDDAVDRQVDAAGQDDQGLAEADEAEPGRLLEHVGEVPQRAEAVAEGRADRGQRHQQAEHDRQRRIDPADRLDRRAHAAASRGLAGCAVASSMIASSVASAGQFAAHRLRA